MFGWLAKMLLQTPVSSSGCACCEAKREHLEKCAKRLRAKTGRQKNLGARLAILPVLCIFT